MYGDNPRDSQFKQAWHAFCEDLKDAGDLIFRDTTPTNDIDRAKGLRLLSRNIALSLQFKLENNNPDCPEFMHYFDPVRKQGGDNADALYVGAPVNGKNTYRIHGHRGSARYFAVTVLEDGDTPWGGRVIGDLIDSDLSTDEHGNFELILSPHPHEGNWIKTTPDSWRVTVRQFFADWENEQPMRAQIDCLDAPHKDAEPGVDRISKDLAASAAWVRESTQYWADMIDKWQREPLRFLSYRQLDDNAIDATPGGEPLICYWTLPRDEALIIRVVPPQASYWAVEFGNYWWETMDYRYRLTSTNCHYASLRENGELLLVVAHDDPGVSNWLDPSGHEEGYVTVRWIRADHYPAPTCERVALSMLDQALPDDVERVTPQQRLTQLACRRRGILSRFGY